MSATHTSSGFAVKKFCSNRFFATRCIGFRFDSRATVDAPALCINSLDLPEVARGLSSTSTFSACFGSVVVAARYTQQSAHQLNRISVTTSVDTGVLHFGSLAKYAASFRKSRSFLIFASSYRKRLNCLVLTPQFVTDGLICRSFFGCPAYGLFLDLSTIALVRLRFAHSTPPRGFRTLF